MKNRLSLMLATLMCLSYVATYGQELAWTPQVGVATSASDDKLTPSLTPYITKNMNITDDGVGGMIMCWSNGSQNGSAIFAQRVDAFGKLKWTTAASGLLIRNTGTDGPRIAQCAGDGNGGAYIGWVAIDSVSGLDKQFLQHVSATGALLWGLNGVTLTSAGASALSASSNASIMQMEKDGAGGTLIEWYTFTSDPSQGIFHVARINGAGSTPVYVWGPIAVLARSVWQSAVTTVDPLVSSDGSGGAYVAGAVTDIDTNYYACMAHVNATGGTVFDKQITTSSSAFNATSGFQLVADVNGAVLAYVQATNAVSNLVDQSYAISVDASGATRWGPELIHNSSDLHQINVRIAPDGSGGCYAVMNDAAKSKGMFLQHIDHVGLVMLATFNSPAGVSLDGVGASYAQVVSDGSGNAICSWSRAGSVVVQKYNGNGVAMWSPAVIAGTGTLPVLAPDNAGGVFVGWSTAAAGNLDLYAQHIAPSGSLGVPRLSTPSILAFPPTASNTGKSVVPLFIQNTGMANLVITTATVIAGRNAAEFSLTGTPLPRTIAPGTMDTLWIAFAPKDSLGARQAQLRIASNDIAAGTVVVALSGTGIGQPQMMSALFLDAGYIHVGELDTLTFVVTNAAQATAPLIISQLGVEGYFKSDYTILSTISYPVTLNPGEQVFLQVEFHAQHRGPIPAQLRVFTNDTAPQQTVPIVGYGLRSLLYADPVNIGPVLLQGCKEFDLPVSNFGTADLHIISFSLAGAHPEEFKSLSNTNLSLGPATSGTIRMQFCPAREGSQKALVRLISSDGDTLFVDVRGWGGTGTVLRSTGTNNFGVASSRQQLLQRLEIVNISDVPTTISQSMIAGKGEIPFTANFMFPYTIAPGDSISVPVKFVSSSIGTYADSMFFYIAGKGSVGIALTGQVIAHPFQLKPFALFGDTILVGHTETGSVVINNVTSGTQLVNIALLTGPDASAYTVLSNITWPLSIKANGADTIVILFHPRDMTTTRVYRAALAIAEFYGDTVFEALHGTGMRPTDVGELNQGPSTVSLLQNYPNPFSQSTRFVYEITARSNVELVVLDMLGREVARMEGGVQDAGVYQREWSSSTLSTRVYTLELRTDGVARKRMTMQVVR